jgi:hypothetical protein
MLAFTRQPWERKPAGDDQNLRQPIYKACPSPFATLLFQALLIAFAIGSVDLAEDFIKRWIGKDAQPQAFSAGDWSKY